MVNLVSPSHLEHIRRFKSLFSRYQRSRDLISVGAYAAGSDPQLDQAIAIYPRFESFLQQNLNQHADFASSIAQLHACSAPAADERADALELPADSDRREFQRGQTFLPADRPRTDAQSQRRGDAALAA
jgi:hypothetical protein